MGCKASRVHYALRRCQPRYSKQHVAKQKDAVMEDPIQLDVDSPRGDATRETAIEQPSQKGEHRVGFCCVP